MTSSAGTTAARLASVPSGRRPPRSEGPSRREQYSASTKGALVEVAEDLFTEHGYAGTSLDAIVAGAGVTKGALYHHFSGKQAVFEAVFARVEHEAALSIQRAVDGRDDPWERTTSGLRAFLEAVRRPAYRRIVIQEGPAVLGHERFREQEERSTFAQVQEIVRAVLSTGTWEPDDEMLATFSRIFFGAMSSAGESVSASDPAAGDRVETAITFILTGLRGLLESGAEPGSSS